MRNTIKKNGPFILVIVALLLFVYTVIISKATVRVDYTVIDSEGVTSLETWEKNGAVISHFDEKRHFIGQVKYSMADGLYEESTTILENESGDQTNVLFLFEKSPELLTGRDTLSGQVEVSATGVNHTSKLASTVEVATRATDGRTICVTMFGEVGGPVNIITKLYDNKTSTYHLPDEVLDQIISGNEIISTIHFVAKGRKFIPLTYKNSNSWT